LITLNTKLIGLLGDPLKFSFSQRMQNAMFKEYGLDYFYLPIEIGKENLEHVVKGMRYMNFAGFNVTKPNKVRVMRYLDEIDDLAQKIGAVNTVNIVDGKLIGYNTDGIGYVSSLREQHKFDPKGKRVTVLGAGGAGRAIAFTLAKYGVEDITVLDLDLSCAQKVSSEINQNMAKCARHAYWSSENLKNAINNSQLLINATGVGMKPKITLSPIEASLLHENILVSDLTYNPTKTQLLHDAEGRGCKIHNGVGMLAHQGAHAFEIWTGIQAPIEKMTIELEKIISEIN